MRTLTTTATPAEVLRAGIADLGLALPLNAEAQLLAYLGLLSKWNRVYNLTAVRDERAMVIQHLLDSLAVLPSLAKLSKLHRLADVGSGGGLPGIPLAIARPDLQICLIETNHKKATFLQQAQIELKLPNLSVCQTRVEDLLTESPFDAVISRAFSEISNFCNLSKNLLVSGGYLLAMKGVYPQEELQKLGIEWKFIESVSLIVPSLDAQRHLIFIKKIDNI